LATTYCSGVTVSTPIRCVSKAKGYSKITEVPENMSVEKLMRV
jgi:hypothetical protein